MPKDSQPKPPKPFKPSEYMRARRPYLYSDATSEPQAALSREVLSHHLETITNQKDETRFERLAHRLCERFIAPNLKPQTGPTGGGDGKTDAETHPVSSVVSSRWYVSDLAPAHERWAFAFSAKKDWRSKVRSDVAAVVSTNRGYERIQFVTNQLVSSKKCAVVQDELQAQHGVPVTILDRTWILDRVLNHSSLDIAIESLGLSVENHSRVEVRGPNDTKNLAKLQRVEQTIGDASAYAGRLHALVEDCHHAALLARNLERPREEIDGRFLRVIRLAREHRLPQLELAASYDWAWTSYFWFDDFEALNAQYDDVEKLAIISDLADDLERLSNLLSLLRSSVTHGALTLDQSRLEKRGVDLLAALTKAECDTSRPNNALQAKALALLCRLTERANQHFQQADTIHDLADLWDEFASVIRDSERMGTFPFEQITDTLTELGQFVPESAAFDKLFEVMTDAVAARKTEGEAARRNSTRGFQKLEKGLPYEAIRWFGRAVGLLVKDEYEDELIQGLIGSSVAYEQAGLHWAARNYALAAVTHQFAAFQRTGSITEVNPATLSRWFSTELRLGRVPYILHAYQLGSMITNARARTDEHRKKLADKQFSQGMMLGGLFLRTRFAELRQISQLPDAVERLGLFPARLALLFLMGRDDILLTDGSVPPGTSQADYQAYFDNWFTSTQALDLPTEPDYFVGNPKSLQSRVLGCDIVVEGTDDLVSSAIGEAVLGALEALLATSLKHRVMPQLDHLALRLAPTDAAGSDFSLSFVEEEGRSICVISHPRQIISKNRKDALRFVNWLQEAVVEIFLQFGVPDDAETWARKVLQEENAFSRALTFSDVPTAMNIIFGGDQRKLSLNEWIESTDTAYDSTSATPWMPPSAANDSSHGPTPDFGKGPPPEQLLNFERLKHSDLKVVSPIDVRKWAAAKWRAAFFLTVPDAQDVPPVLCLGFRNRETALSIFTGWRSRFGGHDPEDALRIAIIRRIWTSNPHAYAIVVGPNPKKFPIDTAKTFEFVSRHLVLTPSSSKNLESFLAEYKRHGRYLFAPAHLVDPDVAPQPLMEIVLGKYHLDIREAWEIGDNDPDIMALDVDDPPIIPEGIADPPVHAALRRLALMQRPTK